MNEASPTPWYVCAFIATGRPLCDLRYMGPCAESVDSDVVWMRTDGELMWRRGSRHGIRISADATGDYVQNNPHFGQLGQICDALYRSWLVTSRNCC